MNTIVNRFLLVGDKVTSEMHLKQPGFTYSACGLSTKNKEKIEKFMQTLFMKMSLIKPVFNLIWLMENQNV